MDKTIFILRHGQTDYNKKHIVQGSGVNSHLNDKGRAQASAFYQHYKDHGFDVVLTSKLIRTHQTVEPFIQTGIPWEQLEEINEMSWGIHEGKSSNPEMIAEYRNMIQEWERGNYHVGIEGGESAAQLYARISKFVEHIKSREEQNILVCSHGRAMRCIVSTLKGEALYKMESYQHSNTGLYKIHYQDSRFIFELENDTQHFVHMG